MDDLDRSIARRGPAHAELVRQQAEAMLEADRQAGIEGATPTPLVSIPTQPPGVLEVQEAECVVSMVFRSRTGNTQPHVVSVGFDGVAWCTCRASTPCWAIKAFCRITGRAVFP